MALTDQYGVLSPLFFIGSFEDMSNNPNKVKKRPATWIVHTIDTWFTQDNSKL